MTSNEVKALTGQYVMNTYGRFPVAIERGEGARLYDFEGNEYIDFTSGIGVTDLGYGNQAWADAIGAQAKKLGHVSNLFYTEPAAKLAEKLDCNVIHMDEFFLRPHQRTPQRLAEPGGNVDYERFLEEVLQPLASGAPFSYRPYDCATGELAEPVRILPKPVTVVEGSYSHHPHFGNRYDLKVFLTVSDGVRRQRIEERPAFLRQRFLEEWIPMEQAYFTAFSVAENCHILAMPEDNQ